MNLENGKIILNRSELSDFYGVARTTVDKWVKDGMPCEGGGGKGIARNFNLQAVIRWHEQLIQDGSSDVSEELERERLRKLRRENDEAEGLLAPVSLITEVIQKVANQMVPILESLPLIMKRNFPELSGDQILLVKKSIAECRNIIAALKLPPEWLAAAEKRSKQALEAAREIGN